MWVHFGVRTRGPIFDGRAEQAVEDFAEAAERAVAQQGFRDVHARLKVVLRHPTGYYQSQIRVRAFAGAHVVYDQRVIYGNWLEGTGSRNSPVTRFPGYFTFRYVSYGLNRKAVRVAESVLPPYLRRMQ